MDWATLAYPFSLGLVAAFNPCGFALLPAYLGYFIGVESTDRPTSVSYTHLTLPTIYSV